MKHKGGIGRMWICEECTFVFQLHSVRKNLKQTPFCPSCSDNFEVVPYTAKKPEKGQKKTWVAWTTEELEMLKKCLSGEIAPHQVAIELGRSFSSVGKRIERMRKENYLKGCN